MILQSMFQFADTAPRPPRRLVRKLHRTGVAPLVLGLAMAASLWGCGSSGNGSSNPGSGGATTGGTGGATAPSGGSGGSTGGPDATGGGPNGATGGSGVSTGGGPDAAGGAPDATGGTPDATGAGGPVINPPNSVVWQFDNLKTIGTNPSYNLTVSGAPMVIDTPEGKAIQFDGVKDTLEVGKNPIDVWPQWTAEIIFRIDSKGPEAQRWFYFAGTPGGTGTGARVLFELRYDAAKDTWYQVAFVAGGMTRRLFGWNFPHPAGKWYHVAIVVDGKTMKPYVNGVWEAAGDAACEVPNCMPPNLTAPIDLAYKPIGVGSTRVGSRYGNSAYFKGAVRIARFTPQALTPDKFLPLPTN